MKNKTQQLSNVPQNAPKKSLIIEFFLSHNWKISIPVWIEKEKVDQKSEKIRKNRS